jgi:hypothetical protein
MALAVMLAVVAIVLAGCGGDTERAAEAELEANEVLMVEETGTAAIEESTIGVPESSVLGQLRSNLGVNICVTNSASKNITVRGREGHYDSAKGQGVLQPGQEACFEGTSVFDEDVWVDVQTRNDRIAWTPLLMGNNPWAGSPSAYVYKCMDDSGFDVGKSRSWDSGIVAFDIKREADSGWKQFRVNITDSASPREPNTTPDCWGPSGS